MRRSSTDSVGDGLLHSGKYSRGVALSKKVEICSKRILKLEVLWNLAVNLPEDSKKSHSEPSLMQF